MTDLLDSDVDDTPSPVGEVRPLLELQSLSVAIDVGGVEQPILRDVSLSILPGEALGLVGESGSGKSMTAKAIDRLLPDGARQSGTILFDGQDVSALSGPALRSYRSDVAMIFQDPRVAINPVRSIGDFMTEIMVGNRRMRPRAALDSAVEMLGRVGISDGRRRLDQYPHELSGGLLQRVMIASTLLTQPRLLLADEPTTALDVSTQAEVIGILSELQQDLDLAILFITHDLELASAFCDRTAVMYGGEVLEMAASTALQDDPLHPYSAALGAARPRLNERRARLDAIPGRPLSAVEAPRDACSFAARCRHRVDECVAAHPDLRPLEGGLVRCIRAGELRAARTEVGHDAR
jgi:oligopeptide/dipeptide ABC transporter ATP-binding protein